MCKKKSKVYYKRRRGKKKTQCSFIKPYWLIWPFEQYKWHIVKKSSKRDKRPKARACNYLSKSLNILQRPEAEFTSIISVLTGCYMRKQIVFQTNSHRCEHLSPPRPYLSIGKFGKEETEGGQIPKDPLSWVAFLLNLRIFKHQ